VRVGGVNWSSIRALDEDLGGIGFCGVRLRTVSIVFCSWSGIGEVFVEDQGGNEGDVILGC
jgi:hypothetical protein